MSSTSERSVLTSYLDDFLSRGEQTAFAAFEGLRLERWSYSDIAVTAFQFARELEALDINKGDRILLWARNSPAWACTFFGCILRGVIAVPIDAVSDARFCLAVQNQVHAKLVVTDKTFPVEISNALPLFDIRQIKSLRHGSSPYPANDVAPDDVVQIIFTSGTTSEPKGVATTHRNLLANLNPLEKEIGRYRKWERLVHPVRFLNLVPLSHIFGQFMGIFVPQLLGGEVYFQESLLPSRIIKTVKSARISVIVCVPRIIETMREKIERDYEARHELDRFRSRLDHSIESHFIANWWKFRRLHQMFGWKFWAFVSGGATLNPDTEQFWQRLGFAVIQGYGMTETAGIVSVNHPFKKAHGSIGKVLPGQQVRLDETGEILVRGQNVSAEYWSAVPKSGPGESEWFRTGDAGELDAGGNLFFKGRKKEVIVTSAGMNIYPEDIQSMLNQQPEIRMSEVVEIQGAHGPEPLAVLILQNNNTNATIAIERANRLLEQHQQVRRWAIWPEADFPRTATLKVKKSLVAKRMSEVLRESSSATPVGTFEKIVARVAGEIPERLDASAKLGSDLKLDSLGRVELISALEDSYRVEFDEAAFTEATTLGEVEEIVREGKQESPASYPYPRWQQRWPFTWLHVLLFNFIVWPFTRVMGRPVVQGRSNLEGKAGPMLFVCNHVTLADQALVMFALPGKIRRRLAIAMDGEVLLEMRHPPRELRLFTRLVYKIEYVLVLIFFNVFSMPQKSGFRQSFAIAGELMDRGYSILVFPEGERTKHGSMNRFRPGTGLLVSQLSAPVVPVRLDGLWKLKEANRHFAKTGEVTVTIGQPVDYSSQMDPNAIVQDLEERARAIRD